MIKLTRQNIKNLLVSEFNFDPDDFKIKKNSDSYCIISKSEGINAEIYLNDKHWRKSLTTHINWQLGG